MPIISEQLKPIDTVNGFQIRPGFFREFGAVAIPGGVNFTIHTHGATSCELLLFHRQSRRTLRRDSISGKLQDWILLFYDRL